MAIAEGRRRSRTAYAGLFPVLEASLGILACGVIWLGRPSGPDVTVQFEMTGFLVALCLLLGLFVVRLDRGYLRLTMIATLVSAMTLEPALAGLVGLVAGVSWFRHGPKGHRYAGVGAAVLWTAGASVVRTEMGGSGPLEPWFGYCVVATLMTLANWSINLLGLRLLTGEPIRGTIRATFSWPFVAAFMYFSLAAVLIANELDGTARGYVLAGVVAILSVTLTETLAERRTRAALEAQVADGQRHVGYSRALEGVVHSLRHQLAISKGYLEDVMESRLGPEPRARARAAKTSVDVALQTLDRLQASASPRVEVAGEPVNLRAVAVEAIGLVAGRAENQAIRIDLVGSGRGASVAGDPIRLREVGTELLLNALDATPRGGVVTVTVGTRRGGWAFLSVADSGAGVSDQVREHLFEPHYTTKPAGTGMGLFTAFGVVREHRGKLVYEGGAKRGGVFTILAPRAGRSAESAKPVTEPGDGLNPPMVAERLSR